jgi:hypothetical protein
MRALLGSRHHRRRYIDDVLGILISLGPRLVSLLVVLVLPLFILIRDRCVERLAEADALEECVLGLRVHRALLVQDLLKLILLGP